MRRKLTPDMPFGCKRPLASNVYYPTFNRPNVELVVEPITEITEDSVVTADGRARPVDTIILATGFATTKFLGALDVVGRDGVHIDDAWADGAQAYLGITTTGFPNLFMLYGPNTNNGSIIYMIECQVDYVMQRAATHGRRGHRRARREARRDGRVQRRAAGRPSPASRCGRPGATATTGCRPAASSRSGRGRCPSTAPAPHASRSRRVRDRRPRHRVVGSAHGVRPHHPPHRSPRVTRVGRASTASPPRRRDGTRCGASTTS